MKNPIPSELLNQRGLSKMKELYRELAIDHSEDCPMMIRLATDIGIVEQLISEDEPLFASQAAAR